MHLSDQETNRIGSKGDCRQGIFKIRNPADFDLGQM
jgi:hypothetical protein